MTVKGIGLHSWPPSPPALGLGHVWSKGDLWYANPPMESEHGRKVYIMVLLRITDRTIVCTIGTKEREEVPRTEIKGLSISPCAICRVRNILSDVRMHLSDWVPPTSQHLVLKARDDGPMTRTM